MRRPRRRDDQLPGPQATLLGRGWVLPRWLERQVDPDHPAYTVGGPEPRNTGGRNWTLVGSLDSPHRAAVDGAGLVAPARAGWTIDWWIGLDDRWIAPSREAAVRQRLLDGAPVVETVLRVQGGEVIHRAYGARIGPDAAIIEIENATQQPVSLALAVRPYDLEGSTRIDEIGVDGTEVTVDGRLALRLTRAPGLVVPGSLDLGDAFDALESGRAARSADPTPTTHRCAGGLANVAVVVPLVHTSTVHAAVPMFAEQLGRRRRSPAPPRLEVDRIPPASVVASGWRAQTDGGPTIAFPDGRLADAVDASRRHLLLHDIGREVVVDPLADDHSVRESALMLGALARWGRHEESAAAIAGLADRQDPDGAVIGRPSEWADTGAFLGAIGEHWRLTRDRTLVEAMIEPIVAAVSWIDRHRVRDAEGAARGLLPPRDEHADRPGELRYLDDFWALRGLQDATSLLRSLGMDDAAHDTGRVAAELRVDLLASLELVAGRGGGDALSSSPTRPIDETCIEALAVAWPCEVLHHDHPMVRATADVIRERFLRGPAHHDAIGPRGLVVNRTVRLATAELAVGDERAIDRVGWVLSAASPTWTWPQSIHPRTGSGSFGAGQHGVATAELLTVARHLAVMERPTPDGLRLQLASVVPPGWYGIDWEARDLPTHAGTLGFAIRWHGERPALLWELEPHEDAPAWHLTAPGLGASFTTNERSGEALLDPVELPTDEGGEALLDPVELPTDEGGGSSAAGFPEPPEGSLS
ncbi:MAG: hypothetical protein AAFZ07_23610 [Actinomycetota bacterium]